MHTKRGTILFAALVFLLVLSGAIMGQQAIRRYEEAVLQSADQRLLHTGHTVDRAIAAALDEPLDLLSAAAKTSRVRTAWDRNDPRQAALALEDALTERPQGFSSALTVQDGIPYSPSLTELHFAPQVTPEAPTEALICLDGAGGTYLALLLERSPGRYDGLALDVSAFYREITEALPAGTGNYREQVLLMDARGTTLLRAQDGEVTAALLSDTPASDAGAALLRCQSTGKDGASFVSPSSGAAGESAVRLAVTPSQAGTNGFFAVGVAADYDAFWSPMRSMAARLACSAGLMAAGLVLLVILLIRTGGKSRRYRQELAAVQAKADAVEALNRKTAQLAHHQRLEMIGTLTSSISHEFNNLLSPIMGYSLMALEKLPESDSALYDDILEIYNTSVKAKTLVQRLSDLSRKHSESVFRPLDPDELVRKVMSVAKPAKPEEVEVQLELACAGIRMDGNELQLSQILLNLVLNAFDAMKGQGGTLTLSTSSDGENVLFRVSDTGPGIRPEVIPHIFEPFFTTKSEGYGTGLGLAIVAQMVEDHHGDIDVENRLGVGVTFSVTIPRSQP